MGPTRMLCKHHILTVSNLHQLLYFFSNFCTTDQIKGNFLNFVLELVFALNMEICLMAPLFHSYTGVIQFKVLTTLPMTISFFLLEFNGFWDKKLKSKMTNCKRH